MTHIEWIEQQIKKHQTAIARLTIALEVIAESNRANHPKPKPKPKALPKPRATEPSDMRAVMLDILKEGPATSGDIIAAHAFPPQQVYNALSILYLKGLLTRNSNGL